MKKSMTGVYCIYYVIVSLLCVPISCCALCKDFQEIISYDSQCMEQYSAIFEKVKGWRESDFDSDMCRSITAQDIAQCFPNLAPHCKTLTNLLVEFQYNLFKSNNQYCYAGLPFEMCGCKKAAIEKRFVVLLCQVSDIVSTFDVGQAIVYTAFAERGLLQPWLLVRILTALGYKHIHVNLIGFAILPYFKEKWSGVDEEVISKIKTIFTHALPEDNNVNLCVYLYGYEYIEDDLSAVSNCLDIIDVGRNYQGKLFQEVDPDDFDTYSLICINKVNVKTNGEYPMVNVYMVSDPPIFDSFYVRADPCGGVDAFCRELEKNNFSSRKELINWVWDHKDFLQCKRVCCRLCCSAPIDFKEIVSKKGCENPIVYEMQDGVVRKCQGYIPDFSLYVNFRLQRDHFEECVSSKNDEWQYC